MTTNRENSPACAAGCRECPVAEPALDGPAAPYRGRSLVLLSLLTFMLPLVTAVAGAVLAAAGPLSELLGGAIGLAVGMLAVRAWVVVYEPSERGQP